MSKFKLTRPYRLSVFLSSGKWKAISSYKSTLDEKYDTDIQRLREDGFKVKVEKITYAGNYVISEDKV